MGKSADKCDTCLVVVRDFGLLAFCFHYAATITHKL
jgi:hypothetical protein